MARPASKQVALKHLEIVKTLPENTSLPTETRQYVDKLREKDRFADLPLTFWERELVTAFAARFDKSESSVEVGADGSVKVKQQKQQATVLGGDAANFNMQQAAFDSLVRLEGKFFDQVQKGSGSGHLESVITVQQTNYQAIIGTYQTQVVRLEARVIELEEKNGKGWKKLYKAQKKSLKLHADSQKLLTLLANCNELLEHKEALKNPALEIIQSPEIKEAMGMARKIIEIVEKSYNSEKQK